MMLRSPVLWGSLIVGNVLAVLVLFLITVGNDLMRAGCWAATNRGALNPANVTQAATERVIVQDAVRALGAIQGNGKLQRY